ncbi:MAG TPA: lysylphosphatidylglycerol synthase transmembrane domain-containing protein [Vicinamibacterales bacterium]|nr:lysylphosphatidylglycerol synthase transmembrane domain-containing protein [Vicinamibacterales bacterium]
MRSSDEPRPGTRIALLAGQSVVSVTLLAWLLRGLDTHALGQLLLTLPGWYYAVSLVVIVGGQILYAWRWWLLLSIAGLNISPGAAVRSYLIGVFANNFLPSTIGGDATKIYYLGRAHGYRTILASVVVDRMLGLGSLSLFAAAAAWAVPASSARFAALRLAVTAAAGGACAIIVLAMIGTGGARRWLAPFGASAVKIADRLQRLRLDMAQLLRQPRVLACSGAIVLGYFLSLSLVYLWFPGLGGASPPGLLAVFTAVTMTGVLSNVPISLNGLGVREQLHVWLFAPLGVPREVAVAISLLLFSHILVTSLGGMVLWLMRPAHAAPAAAGPGN